MKRITEHELVEVNVPAGTTLTKFPIPDLPNLREVQLEYLQFYYDILVPRSVISGNAVVDKGLFQLAFLTLENYDGIQFLKQCPIQVFQTMENGISGYTYVAAGVTIYTFPTIQEKDFKNFRGQKVNWPKSYIELSVAPTVGVNPLVFLFSIGYINPKHKNLATFSDRH